MRIPVLICLFALGSLITAFMPVRENNSTLFLAEGGDSSRDSVATCGDSLVKKFTAGLREFNDMNYFGPYKMDSVRWLNLCGKGITNRQLDGKLLNKMKNLQVLDLGYKELITITSKVVNTEEPSENKKRKLDRDVAGGWEYYYQNKKETKVDVVTNRMANEISELPKEMASLKKLKLLILCGNPIPPEEITKLRKALPNTQIVFDN